MGRTAYEKICDWLRDLPAGTQIAWTDATMSAQLPLAVAWAEICAPQVQAQLGVDRLWEICDLETAGDDEAELTCRPEDETVFSVPRDAALRIEMRAGAPVGATLFVGADHRPLATSEPQLRYWCQLAAEADVEEEDGMVTLRVWSAVALSAALERWSAAHAGRDDLTFVFDPSPAPAGDVERYQLAENVYATGALMDALLAMHPDEAAQITAMVRRMIAGSDDDLA